MRRTDYIRSTSVLTLISQLDWETDTCVVINPTQYTAIIRVGAISQPRDLSDATIAVPPATMMAFPAVAREFAFTLTSPSLIQQPDGMPTVVTVIYMRNEPPVAFGSVPLSGLPDPSGTIIDASTLINSAYSNGALTLPAGTNRVDILIFTVASPCTIGAFTLSGNTTGRIYYGAEGNVTMPGPGSTGALGGGLRITIPVSRDVDPVCTFQITPTAGSFRFAIIAYDDNLPFAMSRINGRLMVDIERVDGTPIPVTAQMWPNDPLAQADVFGFANSPGVGAVLCTATITATAHYKIEYEVFSNVPAGNGLHAVLAIAGVNRAFITYPCFYQGVYSRIALNNLNTIVLSNNLAIGAGVGQVSCTIRTYRLT